MDSICKFRIPKDIDEKLPLILLRFSNGTLNFDCSNELSFSSYIKFSNAYDDEKNGSGGPRRVVMAASKRLTYQGCNFEEDTGYRLPIQYFIGVRNKSNGRMKLYRCVILTMKPVLAANTEPPSEPKAKDMGYREKLDLLAMNFGNKAKKRAVNARLKYAVDSSEPLKEVIENIDTKATTRKLAAGSSSSGIDYLPPQNRQAQSPNDVYDIRDIISQEEEDHLVETVLSLHSEDSLDVEGWKSKFHFCKYVSSHVDGDVTHEKLAYLLYYNYMVTFSQLNYSDINKKDPAPSIPEPLKTRLLNNFTISSTSEHGKFTRNKPNKMKDKLFSYMFVLALFIDDFIVNIPSVLEGLKRSLSSAITIAQALGCHIVQRKMNDSVVKFAELRLPLATPSRPLKKKI